MNIIESGCNLVIKINHIIPLLYFEWGKVTISVYTEACAHTHVARKIESPILISISLLYFFFFDLFSFKRYFFFLVVRQR